MESASQAANTDTAKAPIGHQSIRWQSGSLTLCSASALNYLSLFSFFAASSLTRLSVLIKQIILHQRDKLMWSREKKTSNSRAMANWAGWPHRNCWCVQKHSIRGRWQIIKAITNWCKINWKGLFAVLLSSTTEAKCVGGWWLCCCWWTIGCIVNGPLAISI